MPEEGAAPRVGGSLGNFIGRKLKLRILELHFR